MLHGRASEERNASGFLQPDKSRFPNGLQSSVDYVHSKNLSFGLYTSSGNITCIGKRAGSMHHWQQDAAYFAELGVDFVKMDWSVRTGTEEEQAPAPRLASSPHPRSYCRPQSAA